MAKATKKTTETEPKKRIRRTADQVIADLQAKIEQVKARAAAKQAKSYPPAQALVGVAKALRKALAVAHEHKSQEIAQALDASLAALGPTLITFGVRTPDPTERKRGRKPAAA